MDRHVGPDALERGLEHLGVAPARELEQAGVLGGGVVALDHVHLEDRHRRSPALLPLARQLEGDVDDHVLLAADVAQLADRGCRISGAGTP